MKRLLLIPTLAAALCASAEQPLKEYWDLRPDGAIMWVVQPGQVHSDHIEMAGKRVASVLRYGVDTTGRFELDRGMVWPLLRTIPNNTHASLMRRVRWNPLDQIRLGRVPLSALAEKTDSIRLGMADDGAMTVWSQIPSQKLDIKRTVFPSAEQPTLVECWTITNGGTRNVTLDIPPYAAAETTEEGVQGTYAVRTWMVDAPGKVTLAPGESVEFGAATSGTLSGAEAAKVDLQAERLARTALTNQLASNLVLNTPDPVLNEMFAFAKLRAAESIYETKGGPMHGPGGESYYSAIWANDQAEYANPFFPYLGYDYAKKSAENSFDMFARYMNDEWKPIPSSIIAEGTDYWDGAGDRGDASMIAYGASRYALANGDKKVAEHLWPLIQWCLEFTHRKINAEGVPASDSDELEGRFPSGEANLATACLYYDALRSASYLATDLGHKKEAATYTKQADDLYKAIINYFPANVEGYDAYAYYKGNDKLRAWICWPMLIGAPGAQGVWEALFSPKMWTRDGILTESGDKTFWDRATLYAFRAALQTAPLSQVMPYLEAFSRRRLLGEHVPYAIEAWPEGSQRHLSAESALYARIMTEGLFGIRPTGLRSFSLSPRLPEGWNQMSLNKIDAFGEKFDLNVEREKGDKLRLTVTYGDGKKITKSFNQGHTVNIAFPKK